VALSSIALNLPHAPKPAQLGWLRRPLRVLAIGYSLYALGWCFFADSVRDKRSLVVAAYSISALATILTAAAVWWALRRIPADASTAEDRGRSRRPRRRILIGILLGAILVWAAIDSVRVHS